MSDGEALEELAAAVYHLQKAESAADTEEVSDVLRQSLDCMDHRVSEVVSEIGRQEYEDHG